MKTDALKYYAPQARTAFIASMTAQAAKYGITATTIASIQIRGDVAIIGDRPFPAAVAKPRAALVQKIEQLGFDQVMEQVAYSWFNRLCAIRYMELHDYLGHGRRLLSHPDQSEGYQILDDCLDIDLPGLNQQRVRELKLDGTQDEALYRELLLAQCHALHEAMPFLFETIDDETELLLPDNLTKTDSLIKELVGAIPEEDWQNIEIIGWLYQFYISEKKDEVIGKVVASEDIPAATQLFTPNWIVKYMVQNSLGAQWLATYPQSPLKGQMEYYIEPAEQTDEVNAQLAAITPSQLNPEELTLIDPASGSGHILVEAYELFKAIYLERGYRQRDVPQLILEKNLFGIDIDERAAQLTGFALMMKGRADDRRLFERGVKLNVMALQDSTGFYPEGLAQQAKLSDYGLQLNDLTELKRLFEHATTFGSLIQVPERLASSLPGLKQLSEATSPDLFVSEALKRLGPLVQQAELLAAQYDAVVANPPYMGGKAMNPTVKKFAKDEFPDAKSDLFACFIERGLTFSKRRGRLGFMSPFVWMFISTHEALRTRLIDQETITSLVQLEYSGFEGATVPICTFTLQKGHVSGQQGDYIRLSAFRGAGNQGPKTLEAIRDRECGWFFEAIQDDFKKIPGSPIAYWVSGRARAAFEQGRRLDELYKPIQGLITGDTERFARRWFEVSEQKSLLRPSGKTQAAESGAKWFPYQKGGDYRKWYGNYEFLVNWENDGQALKGFVSATGKLLSRPQNESTYFREGLTWTAISSSYFAVRYCPPGSIASNAGMMVFGDDSSELKSLLGLMNSALTSFLVSCLSETLNFDQGIISRIPLLKVRARQAIEHVVATSRADWNAYERSWDFQSFPLLTASSEPTPTLDSSYTAWITQNKGTIAEMKRLEEENNRLFIDAYGLADELTHDVPIEQITLTVNPAYRYGKKLTEDQLWTRFRQDSMEELVSYAIGCMMGRYSLDAPGLIYAHSSGEGFDPSRYTAFPADDDGIVPLTDTEWFDDDACNRVVEFISLAWRAEDLETNLNFLADNLSPKRGESSRDTLRRYLSNSFYKDHMQTYKKRPIYWLFSSGKEKAFQCLVYLHRYNQGTLARMRTEYVIPLTAKLNTHIQKLENDKAASDATSEIKALEKRIAQLHKQQLELNHFDEKLRHFADQRIALDLDDGVKVNYAKFGDLLVDVKAITGNKPEVIA
jgi:type II restriction/modification system DNA methylase subunit YeeA